MLDIIVYKLQ